MLIKAEADFTGKIEALRNSRSETLRIAVGAFISQSWAGAAVTAMKAADAGISISLRELDWWKLSEAVHSGEFDLAIGELSEAEQESGSREGALSGTRRQHHRAGRPRACRAQPGDARGDRALSAWRARACQAASPSCCRRPARLGHLSEDGRFFIPVIECATPRAMIDVVSASNAVCMIWPEYCAEQLRAGALLELPFHPPWLRVSPGHHVPAQQAAVTCRTRLPHRGAEGRKEILPEPFITWAVATCSITMAERKVLAANSLHL